MKFTTTFDYKGREHLEIVVAKTIKAAIKLIEIFYPNSKNIKIKQL